MNDNELKGFSREALELCEGSGLVMVAKETADKRTVETLPQEHLPSQAELETRGLA